MKTEKTDVEPLAPAVCSADFPSLAQAMGYAAWLESAHDCFADRAAIRGLRFGLTPNNK